MEKSSEVWVGSTMGNLSWFISFHPIIVPPFSEQVSVFWDGNLGIFVR
jgi:hypothetical protein